MLKIKYEHSKKLGLLYKDPFNWYYLFMLFTCLLYNLSHTIIPIANTIQRTLVRYTIVLIKKYLCPSVNNNLITLI